MVADYHPRRCRPRPPTPNSSASTWPVISAPGDIYERYGDRAYDLCFAMLRSGDDAADAYQDTFLTAANKLDQLRDTERLRSWLYSVARNQCRARLRRRKRSTPVDDAGVDIGTEVDMTADLGRDELRTLLTEASAGLNDASAKSRPSHASRTRGRGARRRARRFGSKCLQTRPASAGPGGTFARFAPDRSARGASAPSSMPPRLVGWRLQSALAQTHQSPHRRLLDVHPSPSRAHGSRRTCRSLPAAAGARGGEDGVAGGAARRHPPCPRDPTVASRRLPRCTSADPEAAFTALQAVRSSWVDSPADWP